MKLHNRFPWRDERGGVRLDIAEGGEIENHHMKTTLRRPRTKRPTDHHPPLASARAAGAANPSPPLTTSSGTSFVEKHRTPPPPPQAHRLFLHGLQPVAPAAAAQGLSTAGKQHQP